MCMISKSSKVPEPAPPVAPPDILDQEAPDTAKKKTSQVKRAASGTKSFRSSLSIGSGTVAGPTRSGGLNI